MKRLPLLGRLEGADRNDGSGPRTLVRVWVVGAVEDAGALRFARALATALDAPVARNVDELTPAHVAVGLEHEGRVAAALTIVVGGTLPRSAWRPALRTVEATLLVSEPREELARRLGERLRTE